MNVRQAALERIQYLCCKRHTTINEILNRCTINTAAEIALLSGVSTDLFVEELEQICKALDVSIVDFFTDSLFLSLEQE